MENILKTLTLEDLSKIHILSFKKDTILFNEGDECSNISIVKDGKVNIVSYTLEGKEIIYRQLNEGEMFGNNLIFSSHPIYRGDVVAKTDGIIFMIEKDKLLAIMMSNKNFLEAYLSEASDFSIELNKDIKLLTFNNAEDRVLYLLSLSKNRLEYNSVTDLAKRLFLTREATSRVLHKLEAEKLINIGPKVIVKQN